MWVRVAYIYSFLCCVVLCFVFMFDCHRPVSYVPNLASVSVLFIFDCPSNERVFTKCACNFGSLRNIVLTTGMQITYVYIKITLLTGFCLGHNCSYVMLFIIKTKVYPPRQR